MIGQGIRRLRDRFTPFLRDLAHLAVGTDGQVLTLDSGKPVWADAGRKSFDGGPYTLTLGGLVDVEHNLGAEPSIRYMKLVCVSAEFNWEVGDKIIVPPGFDYPGSASQYGIWPYTEPDDETSVLHLRVGNTGIRASLFNKTTLASAALTASKWKLEIGLEVA